MVNPFLFRRPRACFVHMPKCGGTAIRLALEALLGFDRLRLDYGGVPGDSESERHQHLLDYVRHPELLDRGCCVYGHFRPVKYLGDLGPATRDIALVTVLRDPIERLISHYRYLRAMDDPCNQACVILREHNYDFGWFAMQPRLRNIYSRHLYQIPLVRVDILGVYEQLDLAWRGIASLLRPGKEVGSLTIVNTTNQFSKKPIARPVISATLATELEECHGEDFALYAEAQRRNQCGLFNA